MDKQSLHPEGVRSDFAVCEREAVRPYRVSAAELMFTTDENGSRFVKIPGLDFELQIKTDAEGKQTLHFAYQSVSDIHLGTRQSRAKRTSQMFEHTSSDRLDLVGDIIDGEHLKMKSRWNWAPWHRQVVGHVLRRVGDGVEVNYLPGNHDIDIRGQKTIYRGLPHQLPDGRIINPGDELAYRDLCRGATHGRPTDLAGINFSEEARYVDPKGRRFKIIHGDQFDNILFGRSKGPLYFVGSFAYDALVEIDASVQRLPRCEYISVAAIGKRATKTFINQFLGVRRSMMTEVDRNNSVDGMLYGHSHMMEIGRTEGGKLLINDGCCTEHVQTAVHDRSGTWAVLEWHKDHMVITSENGLQRSISWSALGLKGFMNEPTSYEDRYTQKADALSRLIYRTWPPLDRQRERSVTEIMSRRRLVTSGELRSKPLPLDKPHKPASSVTAQGASLGACEVKG